MIGDLIKETRALLGMSQSELADRAGLRREQLSRIESNQTPNLRPSTIKKIADALGKDVSFFRDAKTPYHVDLLKIDPTVMQEIMRYSAVNDLSLESALEKMILECLKLHPK